jgi:hypothetical protein
MVGRAIASIMRQLHLAMDHEYHDYNYGINYNKVSTGHYIKVKLSSDGLIYESSYRLSDIDVTKEEDLLDSFAFFVVKEIMQLLFNNIEKETAKHDRICGNG